MAIEYYSELHLWKKTEFAIYKKLFYFSWSHF
jgi:hypothetical protein